MQTVLVLIALLHFARAGDILDEWKAWKINYDRNYTNGEENQRFKIWQNTRKFVNSHNELFEAGNTTFQMKLNAFADKTEDELRKLLNSMTRGNTTDRTESTLQYVPYPFPFPYRGPPRSIDWRPEGYVTPVKNQGPIGSCYAFSALGALEGQHFKKTRRLIPLSEQQVVDCDQGSNGGDATKVYEYAKRVGGIQSEKSYPYTAQANGNCTFDCSEVVATVKSYRMVTGSEKVTTDRTESTLQYYPYPNPHRFGYKDWPFVIGLKKEDALRRAVANVGPISVGHIKVFRSFCCYHSGVYYEQKCDTREKPSGYHAMVAVGYGTQDGEDYWIVKNSWGTGWGEDGYIRMSRNRGNNCGIASYASYPISGDDKNSCGKNKASLETTTKGAGTRVVSTLGEVLLSTIITAVLL